jgi:hypothetical protein
MRPILLHIALFATLLATGAFVIGGTAVGLGAMAGGAVALVNGLGLAWIVDRLVHGTMRQKTLVSVVLCLKFGVLAAVSALLIVGLGVHPVGFLVGVTALVLGSMSGATVANLVGEEI